MKGSLQLYRFSKILSRYVEKLSHMLAPLTKLISNKVKYKCAEFEQKVFESIKRILDRIVLLDYLCFDKNN